MLGDIYASEADLERARHVLRRPVFHHVEIENLKLSSVNPAAHTLDGLCKKVLLPGGIPFRSELRYGGVRDAFSCGGPLGFIGDELAWLRPARLGVAS